MRARAEFVAVVVVVAADISEFCKVRAKAAVPWDLFIAFLLFLSLSLERSLLYSFTLWFRAKVFSTTPSFLVNLGFSTNCHFYTWEARRPRKQPADDKTRTTTTTTEHDVANPTETTTGVVVVFSVFFFSFRRHRRVDHPSARVRMHSKVSQRETSSSS